MSDIWHGISDVWCQVWYVRRLMSDVVYQTSDVRCLKWYVSYLVSEIWCGISDVWCSILDIWSLMRYGRRLMCDVSCGMSDVWCAMSDVVSLFVFQVFLTRWSLEILLNFDLCHLWIWKNWGTSSKLRYNFSCKKINLKTKRRWSERWEEDGQNGC